MSARPLATFQLSRREDNSLLLVVLDSAGVARETGGFMPRRMAVQALRACLAPPVSAPAPLDPSTGRPAGDHGTASQAIEFALEHEGLEADTFLRAWQGGDLGEWPEYYEWLREQERPIGWRTAPGGPDHRETIAADLGFVDGCEGGAGRASFKKSHRAEGRNFVD